VTVELGPAASLADIEAMEARPIAEILPFRTSYQLFERSARLFGDRPALKAISPCGPTPPGLSYRELFYAITGVANQYADLGLGAGETVAVILPNFVETHLAMWGAEAIGRVCLINAFLEPDHIRAILLATETRIVVTEFADDTERVNSRVAEAILGLDNLLAVVGVRTFFGGDADARRAFPAESLGDDVRVATLSARAEPEAARFSPVVDPEAIASYLHTGGTTGAPKVAARTHRNATSQGWIVSALMGLGEEDVLLCGLPLFHSNGVTVTGVAPFSRGSSVVLATADGYRNPRVIEAFWSMSREHGVTHFAGVPTIYSRLLETFDGPAETLKFGICGAAPMSVDLFNTFERETGVRILEGYGLTEAGCVSTLNPVGGKARIGSIGLRLPYQELGVVSGRHEPLVFCEDGEPGEIIVRGPNVFAGYVDNRHNDGVLLGEGWLATGDLGRRDADGYVWLTGRAKDLIIRGGHNIDPAVAEAALSQHPDVALVAVVGRPDADLGERPIAYVTLRLGRSPTDAALLEFARGAVSERAAAPAAVTVIESMPVTAVGKIYKPELRRLATQDAIDDALAGTTATATIKLDPKGVLSCKVEAEEPDRSAAIRCIARLVPHLVVDYSETNFSSTTTSSPWAN
jgi:fatty-acyl-CoA synthase